MFSFSYYIFTQFLFYVIVSSFTGCLGFDYCGPDFCDNNKEHVMCTFQEHKPSSNCAEFINLLTEKDKQLILAKINDRRNRVAMGDIRSLPPADNMRKMAWNEELATFAERWACQCVTHHVPDIKDSCRDLGNMKVEQNIATILGESRGLTPATLVDVWYTELLNINSTIITRFRPSNETGLYHYNYFTQLVWADSSQVGCGAVKFKDIEGEKNQTVYRLVCNFASAGNRRDKMVYSPGEPCSRCPGRTSCDAEYRGLCDNLVVQRNVLDTIDEPSYSTQAHHLVTTFESISEANNPAVKYTNELYDNDDEIPFNYISRINEVTQPTENVNATPCKFMIAMDDLVELLKKKLSDDPVFKNILTTRVDESNYSDSGVVEFASKIYSKKTLPTTAMVSEEDYVNSTALAELVEAVVFRQGDRNVATEPINEITTDKSILTPRITVDRAELVDDVTGHYFFPEDEEGSGTTEITTDEVYDEVKEIPIADVLKEFENLKRVTETKDFIDEILESELMDENANDAKETTLYTTDLTDDSEALTNKEDDTEDGKKNNLNSERKRRGYRNGKWKFEKKDGLEQISEKSQLKSLKSSKTCSHIHYNDLLKKILDDLKKINVLEKIHCSSSRASTKSISCLHYFSTLTIIYFGRT